MNKTQKDDMTFLGKLCGADIYVDSKDQQVVEAVGKLLLRAFAPEWGDVNKEVERALGHG